jgi:hypothetical protein
MRKYQAIGVYPKHRLEWSENDAQLVVDGKPAGINVTGAGRTEHRLAHHIERWIQCGPLRIEVDHYRAIENGKVVSDEP